MDRTSSAIKTESFGDGARSTDTTGDQLVRELHIAYGKGDPKGFSVAVRETRDWLEWPVDRLADRLGVSVQAVYRWENAQTMPRRQNVEALVALLERPLLWLDEQTSPISVAARGMPVAGIRFLQRSAAQVWNFSVDAFTEAGPPDDRRHVVEFLLESEEARGYCFIFPEGTAAAESFGALRTMIEHDCMNRAKLSKLHGVELAPEAALGWSRTFPLDTRTLFVELDTHAQREQGRVWQGFSQRHVVLYDGDEAPTEPVWLDWPADRARDCALEHLVPLARHIEEDSELPPGVRLISPQH